MKTGHRLGAALLLLLLPLSSKAAPPVVSNAFGLQGLSSLQVGNAELLWRNPADRTGGGFDGAVFWVPNVTLREGGGKDAVIPVGGPSSVRIEAERGRVIRTFAWGQVTGVYAARENRLNLTVTVVNTSRTRTKQAIAVQPLWLQFPQPPKEYDGTDPLLTENLGSPSVIGADYGTATSHPPRQVRYLYAFPPIRRGGNSGGGIVR